MLPLSISGAVSMARANGDTGDGYLSGDDWFVYKFDKQQAGLAGGCGRLHVCGRLHGHSVLRGGAEWGAHGGPAPPPKAPRPQPLWLCVARRAVV